MTIFNDLDFKIMKVTLYVVEKINHLLFLTFRACTCYKSIDCREKQFELSLGTNNISRVMLFLH